MELTSKRDQREPEAVPQGLRGHCYGCLIRLLLQLFPVVHEEDRLEELRSPEHLQTSCLQVGFYLASWGMFRG